jgi:hypothetical protein
LSDFDILLSRQVRSGEQYDHLLPKTKCKSTYVGDGLTDHSVVQMTDVILKHEDQTQDLAKVLQQPTVSQTVVAIHDFLYWHLQYKADDADQLLRSPACSWYSRHDGIDCKSYSIFASCLLLNLNVVHYIRKIKQPTYAPNDYTHVYIVVPKNQKTANLNDGYYIIDGTLKNNIEPRFSQKHDTKMAGLKHYALNGAAPQSYPWDEQSPENGNLNFAPLVAYQAASSALDTIKGFGDSIGVKFGINDVVSFFKGNCGRGDKKSAYNDGNLEDDHQLINGHFQAIIDDMANNLAARNMVEFSKKATQFLILGKIMVTAYEVSVSRGFNACSSKNMQNSIKLGKFYRDTVGGLLKKYLEAGFTKDLSTAKKMVYNAADLKATAYWLNHYGPFSAEETYYLYTPRPGVSIPKFELTQYAVDVNASGEKIDTNKFLNSLTDFVIKVATPTPVATPQAGQTPPYIEQTPANGQGIVYQGNAPTQQTAGFGVMGIVIAVAGLGIIMSMNKSKN